MKKYSIILFLISISIYLISSGCVTHNIASDNRNNTSDHKYKNIIVMIPDGCSMSIQTFARYYKGSDLNLDNLNAGSVRTFAANSIITDSAAAATAFATGHKTTTGFLGVGPRTDDLLTGFQPDALPYAPVPSILEGAKYIGKSTGIVVTSVIPHATPAGFAAHVPGRTMYDDIMEQIVYQNIDVVFGGGLSFLLPKGKTYKTKDNKIWHGARSDSEDLVHTLIERGYTLVNNREDMINQTGEKVWGLFNDRDLVPDIDRDELNPGQPSLAEMTEKALEILSKNKNGFFLVVEGSQVDYAGHYHDPAFMVTEFLAFDKSVGKAVDFAKKDGNTLVIIFPDHDTGGLSLGNNSQLSRKYTSMSLENLLSPVKNAEITIDGLLKLAGKDNQVTGEEIQDLFMNKWRLPLDNAQAGEIVKNIKNVYAVSDFICQNFTILGWTSSGHTGTDVPLWVYPCKENCAFHGSINNSQIAVELARVMDVDLEQVQNELFIEAGSIFPDYKLLNEETGNVLEIGGSRLPVNKNIINKGDLTFRTRGVTVHAPDIGEVFISREAVNIIKSGD